MRAYILVTTEVGTAIEVQRQLRSVESEGVRVEAVDLVAGNYDLIMVAEADGPQPIGQLVLETIHRTPGVAHTVTLFQLG